MRAPRPLRRRLFYGLGALVFLTGVALAVLRFGNPQWHRWLYQYQAYVSPGHCCPDCGIPPPEGFSGTYHRWGYHGEVMEETEYDAGQRHGRSFHVWSSLGSPGSTENYWVHGRQEGCERCWDDSGELVAEGTWVAGFAVEGTFRWHGRIVAIKDGRPWDGEFLVSQTMIDGVPQGEGYAVFFEGMRVEDRPYFRKSAAR